MLLLCQTQQSTSASPPYHMSLAQICEDSPQQLERPVRALNSTSSNALVPCLLTLFRSHNAEARCLAVACLNLMAGNMPTALADALDQYV